jgi:biotin synthase
MTLSINVIKDKAFSGQIITFEEAMGVLNYPNDSLDDLFRAVVELREFHRGRQVAIQVITSVKNGDCSQDCQYCAQAADSLADIPKYSLLAEERLLEKARLGQKYGASHHCLGFSGLSFTDEEIETFCRQIALVKQEAQTDICCSIGLLTRAQAIRLKESGVSRINHNLNTSARYYSYICSTHSYAERLANLKLIKSVGLEICCGGIVGMGEEPYDVVDMLMTLKGLKPNSTPINFYVPVPGTTLANKKVAPLSQEYCLKVLALARFLLPNTEIRCAAGREKYLSDQTKYVLAACDSIFANGYLTVDGLGLEPTILEIQNAGYTAVMA